MSHARPARKVGLSACTAAAPWRRAALGATLLATVASGAGVVAGLALGGARAAGPLPPACAAPDTGAAAATARVAVPVSGGAVPAPGFTEVRSSVATGYAAGLPVPAGVAVRPPGDGTREPRRTRAQRLVSAQLDAMVARAGEPVASSPAAADDATTDAFPDPASGELQQETARAVLAGMLEGFAGVPPRAQGSPDAATEP